MHLGLVYLRYVAVDVSQTVIQHEAIQADLHRTGRRNEAVHVGHISLPKDVKQFAAVVADLRIAVKGRQQQIRGGMEIGLLWRRLSQNRRESRKSICNVIPDKSRRQDGEVHLERRRLSSTAVKRNDETHNDFEEQHHVWTQETASWSSRCTSCFSHAVTWQAADLEREKENGGWKDREKKKRQKDFCGVVYVVMCYQTLLIFPDHLDIGSQWILLTTLKTPDLLNILRVLFDQLHLLLESILKSKKY